MRTIPYLGLLTDRQRDVVRLASSGLSNDPIAEQLCISKSTVLTTWQFIYARLGIRQARDEAIARFLRAQ